MTKRVCVGDDRVRSTVLWRGGHLLFGGPHVDGIGDVRLSISMESGPYRVASGVLVVQVYEEVKVVKCADGVARAVQTFRYRNEAGELRWFTLCTCGDRAVVTDEDLAWVAVDGCRACGAGLFVPGIDGPCVVRHAFGTCLYCPVGSTQTGWDACTARTGAQSGPAHDAGPATTGGRSAVAGGAA